MVTVYDRWQKNVVLEAMRSRRVLLLNGPRQCGKTTLVRQLISADTEYRTLDDPAWRGLAANDPHGFVRHGRRTLIIDEVQCVPALLSAIKMVVDEDMRPGRYLLTGSASIQSLSGVTESLAGRVRRLRLRPLSQGELLGAKPAFLGAAFRLSFPEAGGPVCDRDAVLDMSLRGGFPEAVELSERDRRQWHRDYLDALLDRDLRDIARIQRRDAMQKLVEVVAAWSGKYVDISGICSGLSIRRPTVEAYINALEAMYVVERVSPWVQTDYARVGKQSKFFMSDSGLMSSVLGCRREQVALDPDRLGKLIETFVFNELSAQIDATGGEYRLYHYRDREQREIDFLIEHDGRELLGIEVKAGSAISRSDFKHLRWFKDQIAGDRPFAGIVLYTGTAAGSMGDNLWAVPFSALWSRSPDRAGSAHEQLRA